MAIEYRGEETLYGVEVPDDLGTKVLRAFNQTDGSTNLSADEIDLDTKDKTGSDYGKVTEEISISGIITEGDPFVDLIKRSIRQKKFVKVVEINTRTLTTESGMYMISSFEQTFSNGEFSTYTLAGKLNGSIVDGTLEEVPAGAPESDIDSEVLEPLP